MTSVLAFKVTESAPPTPSRFDMSEFTCSPSVDQRREELHWLAFVNGDRRASFPFQVQCELWRWEHGAWHCVTLPGAVFTASQMYDQGWRYCKPCPALIAVVRS